MRTSKDLLELGYSKLVELVGRGSSFRIESKGGYNIPAASYDTDREGVLSFIQTVKRLGLPAYVAAGSIYIDNSKMLKF